MTDSQEPVVGHSDGQLAAVGGHGGGEVPLVLTDLDQRRAGALPQQGAWVTVTLGVGDELHEAVQLLREPVPVSGGVAADLNKFSISPSYTV